MGRKVESDCHYWQDQLAKDQARLADLEERGDAACSNYDLRFGYDAEFNKQLKRNHIAYDLKQLEKCPRHLIEMTPVQEITPAPIRKRQAPQPAEEQTVFQQGRLF